MKCDRSACATRQKRRYGPGVARPGAALAAVIVLFQFAAQGAPTATNSAAIPLDEMSIEQLVNIPVTSVSKKQTPLSQSPAAIAVVTGDDMRRLGIDDIPDALRLVPGLDVAQINANQWAISSRGFNYFQYANKLLVMMDGRSVYTPTFGGVFWDTVDGDLPDLDRIEVIRGPGATLWGANAVNGVINIISKSAKDTQGGLVTTTVGEQDRPSTTVRYGGQLATNLYYRVYGKYFNRDGLVDSRGRDTPDDWNATRGGFRLDWLPSDADTFTLEGDAYYNETAENIDQTTSLFPPAVQSVNARYFSHGADVMGRWKHHFSDTSDLTVQSYFDDTRHEVSFYTERRDTADLDIQHRFALGERNDVIWGVGYRFSADRLPPSAALAFTPESRDLNLYTAFAQDQIALVPDRLSFIAGSKLEHNDFTGFEYEPSARLLWTPTERQTVWTAVSRAVRTPDRVDSDGRVNEYAFNPATPVILQGNPALDSEKVYAFELGYRIEPVAPLSFDLAGYYNLYRDLLAYQMAPGTFPVVENAVNGGSGHTYGAELSANWQVTDLWRLAASYSWYHQNLEPTVVGTDVNPQQQAQLRSYLDLPHHLELNGAVYYVDQIDALLSTTGQKIPAYVSLDLGLVWRPTRNLEIGVWGQNLLQDRHAEFASLTTSVQTEVPRNVLGRITWRF